jgi:dihydrolipoamide dehydrogenase
MRTNVAGIYAAGDVNGRFMLAHVAHREAEAAVNAMIGKEDTMRYDAVPSVIYTHPEAAFVGDTLDQALARGLDASEHALSMRYSGRFVAENEGDGVCKVVVENKTGRLLGVHLLGSYASEIIYGVAAFIGKRMTAGEIREMIFPHPTVSEVIREALFLAD